MDESTVAPLAPGHARLTVPEAVLIRLKTWRTLWNVFLWAHYMLGMLGVLSSSLAAGLPKEGVIFAPASRGSAFVPVLTWAGVVTGFAVLSACCFAVIGFVAPERRYLGLVRAWRVLDLATARFKAGQLTEKQLLDTLERAEVVATEPSQHDLPMDKLSLGAAGAEVAPSQGR